jgi:hypothetical protein
MNFTKTSVISLLLKNFSNKKEDLFELRINAKGFLFYIMDYYLTVSSIDSSS